MSTKIQLRRDTAVNWTTSNPVLAIGEIGVVTSGATIVNMRMGDGVTAFNSLSLLKLSFFNADDMVKTVHLQANSVTSVKLLSDASVDANRAVTSDHIKDVAVTTAKIAANAVTSAKLLSDASVNANRAVESNHIKDSQVITRTIADDNVTYAKIQNVAATDKLLGRATAGAGDIEEIACTSFARTILDDVAAVNVRTTIGAKENITEPVTTGGTGATSLAVGNVLLGNGTSAVAVVAPSTSGNVLVSNGSTWVSANPITANTSGNAATASSCTGNSATATDVSRLPVGATNAAIGMLVCGTETWNASLTSGAASFVSRRSSHSNQFLQLDVTVTSTWVSVIHVKVVGGGTWFIKDFDLFYETRGYNMPFGTLSYQGTPSTVHIVSEIVDVVSTYTGTILRGSASPYVETAGTTPPEYLSAPNYLYLSTISAGAGNSGVNPNSFSTSSFIPLVTLGDQKRLYVGPFLKYSMVRIA